MDATMPARPPTGTTSPSERATSRLSPTFDSLVSYLQYNFGGSNVSYAESWNTQEMKKRNMVKRIPKYDAPIRISVQFYDPIEGSRVVSILAEAGIQLDQHNEEVDLALSEFAKKTNHLVDYLNPLPDEGVARSSGDPLRQNLKHLILALGRPSDTDHPAVAMMRAGLTAVLNDQFDEAGKYGKEFVLAYTQPTPSPASATAPTPNTSTASFETVLTNIVRFSKELATSKDTLVKNHGRYLEALALQRDLSSLEAGLVTVQVAEDEAHAAVDTWRKDPNREATRGKELRDVANAASEALDELRATITSKRAEIENLGTPTSTPTMDSALAEALTTTLTSTGQALSYLKATLPYLVEGDFDGFFKSLLDSPIRLLTPAEPTQATAELPASPNNPSKMAQDVIDQVSLAVVLPNAARYQKVWKNGVEYVQREEMALLDQKLTLGMVLKAIEAAVSQSTEEVIKGLLANPKLGLLPQVIGRKGCSTVRLLIDVGVLNGKGRVNWKKAQNLLPGFIEIHNEWMTTLNLPKKYQIVL